MRFGVGNLIFSEDCPLKRAMPGTTKEVHLIITTNHQLVVNGVELVEEKSTTTVTSKNSGKLLEEKRLHVRRIGSRLIRKIVEGSSEKEETEMSNEEKDQFNSQWKKYWRPTLDCEEAKKMLEKDEDD